MSSHKVGVLGSTGNVGHATWSHLLKYHEQGSIQLVLFHRASNPPKDVPANIGIDFRPIDLQNDSIDSIENATKDLQVLM